jgi:hypothetical protein
VPGRPLARSDLSPDLLARMVDYYAYLVGSFSRPPAARFDQLAECIAVNAWKGLSLDASGFLARWELEREAIDGRDLVLLDGRPQPHEWIEVSGGNEPAFLKTDSADHAGDHTIVGEQSILWDLAGAWEEWRMTREDGLEMLRTWERKTGDTGAAGLIDFYRSAYLAFRLGAMHYALEAEPDDELRGTLEREREAYAERLPRLLRESAPGRQGQLPRPDGSTAATNDIRSWRGRPAGDT